MRKLLMVLLTPLALSGCVGGSATPVPTAIPTYALPGGNDALVLRIDTGGGLVPPGYILTHIPGFSLYSDGRIVVIGPMDASYPAALLPNLRVIRVTPDEIQSILRSADAAGLMGPDASYPGTGIYDAGTTFFTLNANGATHKIAAYALMANVKGENAAADAARAKLLAFWEKTQNLGAMLGRQVSDEEAYQASGLRLIVRQADATQPAEASTLPWPLGMDPFMSGQATKTPNTVCTLVTGSDMAAFVTAAQTATALMIWTYGPDKYSIGVRPLLPDEASCGDTALFS